MQALAMKTKTCTHCDQQFFPSRYHPSQNICSSVECQRQRKADYHRKKLSTDPAYREQCRDSQRKWREKNPQYMKKYLARRRSRTRLDQENSRLIGELRRIQDLVKNNAAFDLRSVDASIWLVCAGHARNEKNTFARAKLIVVEGVVRSIGPQQS